MAFDLLLGTGYRSARVQASDVNVQVYEVQFQKTLEYYWKTSISYTYWPTKRFGISLGREILVLPFNYNLGREGQIQDAEAVALQYPNMPLQIWEQMDGDHGQLGDLLYNLTLGVAFRL